MLLPLWTSQLRTARVMMDAHTVIGLRMLGFAGVIDSARDEPLRMVMEKQHAFAEAGAEATRAMWQGQSALRAYDRALAPIGRTAHNNAKRLRARRLS
ncbi:hypothetical protein JANAI62_23160 [Jannaschia pagri]|uniref:Phasin protein n=1 Tax=Jannaschia pagri TaxID=2829797 RepID=A0ABQ4NMP5_9RHOB|nr:MULTISPECIES: hypothetical protein [unclassified Jannaschia]GIT91859.1 hypothetical protein JANAI61_23170 [Jannaschia sp. AI_61]GIT95693.1 hypothetical protein JANAI62_23160 [Jannaschia sp. AI_62]